MSADTPFSGVPASRRQFLFGGAMLATAAAAVAATPRGRAAPLAKDALAAAVPMQLGEWRAEPSSAIILPPEEGEAVVYDQLLTRAYANPAGDIVMLLVAYGGGQTGIFEVHRPEACYPANGFTLGPRREVPLAVGAPRRTVNSAFYTATSYGRIEQLLYWTRIGPYFPETWAQEHLAVVRSNLAGILPDGVLVRISTLSADAAASLTLLESFATTLAERAGPVARHVLLGVKT